MAAFSFDQHMRLLGVLQRIALCFGLIGRLHLHPPSRQRWLTLAGLLGGCGLLLALGGDLGRDGSLPSRVDVALLRPWSYRCDAATGLGCEPEGLLSTLGAAAGTLWGTLCGDWLRRRESRSIMAAGVTTALALVALHTAIDRRGAPPVGRRFGVNASTAYAGSNRRPRGGVPCVGAGPGGLLVGRAALDGRPPDPHQHLKHCSTPPLRQPPAWPGYLVQPAVMGWRRPRQTGHHLSSAEPARPASPCNLENPAS